MNGGIVRVVKLHTTPEELREIANVLEAKQKAHKPQWGDKLHRHVEVIDTHTHVEFIHHTPPTTNPTNTDG